MSDVKHTPLPWKTGTDSYNLDDLRVFSDHQKYPVASCACADTGSEQECIGREVEKANAAFIVRACNSHDDLVRALELAELWLLNCVPVSQIEGPKPLPVIRAALAKGAA